MSLHPPQAVPVQRHRKDSMASQNSSLPGKIIVFLLIAFLAVSGVNAQDIKPGFVNDATILAKLPERKDVQKILDKESAIWDQRFTDRRKIIKVYLDSVSTAETALKAARTRLESDTAKVAESDSAQVPAADSAGAKTDSAGPAKEAKAAGKLPPELDDTLQLHREFERLEKTLEKEKKEFVAYYHKIYGKDGILNRRNAELSQSILEKVNRSIVETSQTLGVSMVFDASILLYIDQNFNFTDQVMQALNIEQERAR